MDAYQRRLSVLCSHIQPSCEKNNNIKFSPRSLGYANCSSHSHSNDNVNANDDDDHGGGASLRDDGCVFCRIIHGQSPAFKLYEDDTCLCILDTSPLSHGHSLIIPKLHYRSLDVTPPHVIASMCSKIPFISNAIRKATGCDSFNLLVNNGKAAGQVIFHTHIHIIPRKACDRLWASETLRRLSLKLDEEAPQLAHSIREHLSLECNLEEFKGQRPNLAADFRD